MMENGSNLDLGQHVDLDRGDVGWHELVVDQHHVYQMQHVVDGVQRNVQHLFKKQSLTFDLTTHRHHKRLLECTWTSMLELLESAIKTLPLTVSLSKDLFFLRSHLSCISNFLDFSHAFSYKIRKLCSIDCWRSFDSDAVLVWTTKFENKSQFKKVAAFYFLNSYPDHNRAPVHRLSQNCISWHSPLRRYILP